MDNVTGVLRVKRLIVTDLPLTLREICIGWAFGMATILMARLWTSLMLKGNDFDGSMSDYGQLEAKLMDMRPIDPK